MHKPAVFLITAMLAASSTPASADLNNQIPSCYAANAIPLSGPAYDKLFVVLIDQTVQLDQNLENQVLQSIAGMVQPGTHVVVGEFSAFSQGRYLNISLSGIVEPALPADKVGSVPINALPMFNRCMSDQLSFSKNLAERTAWRIMQESTSSLDQSDILMALKSVSVAVKQYNAAQKTMLLVTDGLENSTITSFYGQGGARNINPTVEMRKTTTGGMVADFGGARIYVVGGAMEPPAKTGTQPARNGYRDPQLLMNLEQFWTLYFGASNANLVEFGEPGLVVPVSY